MGRVDCGLKVVVTLILTFVASRESGYGFDQCPRGQFGHSCLYNCHCQESKDCDKDTGSCGSAGCLHGYFGDGCQYVNLAYNMNTSDPSKSLVDGDDGTCTRVAVRAVYIDLRQAQWFRDVRLVTKGTLRKTEFFMAATNTSDVASPDMMWSPEASVTWPEDGVAEVAFDGFVRARYLWVGGKSFFACEVLVYGGRNVGLRRPTSQSSTLGAHVSLLAVDGMTSSSRDGDVGVQACAHTEPDEQATNRTSRNESTWWQVNLGGNYVIRRIRMYTSPDPQNRLRWFRLLTRSTDEASLTTMYQSPGNRLGDVVDIIPPRLVQVALLRLQLTGKPHVLILCEVQLYGDCPEMTYGPDCDQPCACADPLEVCDSFSGSCLSGLSELQTTSVATESLVTEVFNTTSSREPNHGDLALPVTLVVVVVGCVCIAGGVIAILVKRKRTRTRRRLMAKIEHISAMARAPPTSNCAYEAVATMTCESATERDDELSCRSQPGGRPIVFTKPLGHAQTSSRNGSSTTFPNGSEMKCLRARQTEADENDERDNDDDDGGYCHARDDASAGEKAGSDDEHVYEPLEGRDYECPYAVISEPFSESTDK